MLDEISQKFSAAEEALAENPEYYAKVLQSELQKKSVSELQQMLSLVKQGIFNGIADDESQRQTYSVIAGLLSKKLPQQRQKRMAQIPSYNNRRNPNRR